ncbi:hypothetical protein EV356DRAFT_501993 [Viridothelium virens]|uniref:Conidiation-specific protein 8 n=1 Tax=Viridothelium virens TaxID=1048519 RepID=A0A6A6HLM7_VIRVR|nr:hypothetical protein EV356DRAFT_501993 [Viridothelium virens]
MAQNASSSPPSSPIDRRRSSGERFAALNNLKRNSNPDAFAQRRSSLSDQATNKPGFFGQIWQNYTRGSHPEKK